METNRLHQTKQRLVTKSIEKMIDANPDWSEQGKILQSVPGVGPKTSQVLISALPELGTLNRQQVAAM